MSDAWQRLRGRFVAGWDDYWFRPVEPTNLALCRIVYYLGLYWALSSRELFTELDKLPDYPAAFHFPLGIFKYLPLASSATVGVLGITLRVVLVAAALGFMTRLSTLVVFVLVFYLNSVGSMFGKVIHYDAIPIIFTGLLALSRSGDALSIDAVLRRRWPRWPFASAAPEARGIYRWPVQFGCMYVALIYFMAAISKLQASGLDWALSDNMTVLLSVTPKNHGCYHTYSEYPELARWLVRHPPLPNVLAISTLVGELCAPLVLMSGRIRYLYGAVLLAMNISFYIVLGPDFRLLMISFTFLVPWDRIYAAASRRVRRSG